MTTTELCRRPKLVLFLFAFVQLLREVVLHAHFADGMELAFQPVDVVFFIFQDLFQQFARSVVAGFHGGFDSIIQALDRVVLQLEVVLQLIRPPSGRC